MRQLAPDLRLRRMVLSDLPAVMAIEHQAFSNPWSTEMVWVLLQPGTVCVPTSTGFIGLLRLITCMPPPPSVTT